MENLPVYNQHERVRGGQAKRKGRLLLDFELGIATISDNVSGFLAKHPELTPGLLQACQTSGCEGQRSSRKFECPIVLAQDEKVEQSHREGTHGSVG